MKTRTAALLLVGALLAACGTRLPDSAFVESRASTSRNSGDDGGALAFGYDTSDDAGLATD